MIFFLSLYMAWTTAWEMGIWHEEREPVEFGNENEDNE